MMEKTVLPYFKRRSVVHHILEECESRTIIILLILTEKVIQCFQDLHLEPSYIQDKAVVKVITAFQRKH